MGIEITIHELLGRGALAHCREKEKNIGGIEIFSGCVQMSAMKAASRAASTVLCVVSLALLVFVIAARGQQKDADAKGKPDSASKEERLTIIVTGGEEKKPIDSASVYIRYVEGRKIGKDKKVEMNLKTNQSGICHVPEVPPVRFLVQVIAEGWKTYGEYYEPTDSERTININLSHPPKWY